MLDVAMIERGLEQTGKSKGGLAAAMGVRPGAVSEILGGERLVKASEIIPIMEYLELNLAPIMGRVGAGGASGRSLRPSRQAGMRRAIAGARLARMAAEGDPLPVLVATIGIAAVVAPEFA